MRKCLNWLYQGDFEGKAGYNYVAKATTEALQSMSVDLNIQAKTLIYHTIPWTGFSWYEGQKAAIFTMWEHTHLPDGVQQGMKLFPLALTPCKFSADLFKPYCNVEVVPHGIDPAVYYPEPRKRPEVLNVLTAATNLRKGPLEVYEACKQLPFPWHLSLKGKRAKEFDPKDERVTILDDVYDDMRSIYVGSDVYVSASRGEGWDLIAFEALACGVPTIVPEHTAYLDWMHLAQGTLTNFKKETSLVTIFGDSGDWYVQSPDEIAARLTDVWENYDTYAERAYESACEMQREWTWSHSALTLLRALEKHGYDLSPLIDPGEMADHTPLVAVKPNTTLHSIDVGGYVLAPLRKDVIYRVPCEVGRVLTTSGYAEFI